MKNINISESSPNCHHAEDAVKKQCNWCLLQVAENTAWIEHRHKHRVAEIIGFMRGLREEVKELQLEEEDDQ